MRRRLSLFAAVMALAAGLVVAGCGSSSSSSNPLQTSLSYFPKDSLFVLSLQTDPNSSAIQGLQSLLHRFPAVTFGESALIARLQQIGINYDTDVKPLLGNPAVVGVASPSPAVAKSSFLVAWVTKSSDTLNGLVKKLHLSSSQTIDGAKVYSVSTAALAIDGSTLVLGASPTAVKSALDLHSHGGGLTPDDQSKAMGNLPTDSLISAFGDLTAVLSQPSTAQAKKVPWVNALKGYGVAITANATGLTTQYRLDTSGATLSESQLPIAPGSTPPSLAGSLPISVGVNDPSRIVKFVEQAQQLTGPSKYAAFTARQAAVKAKTGVDLNSLLDQLTGQAQLSSDGHATMIRGTLSDPAAAKTTLAKLATDPKAFSAGPVVITHAPGGFYVFKESSHSTTVGVVGDHLVIGLNASPPQLTAFAAAPDVPATGAQGSVAFKVSLPALLALALKQAQNPTVQTVLRSLGDLTGWLAAAPEALTGSATVAIK